MSDAERLRAAWSRGDLARPWSAPTTLDLAHALALATGADAPDAGDHARTLARDIASAEHIVLALVDGLGMHLVDTLSHGSFLRSQLRRELLAVFPSSTAPALTSLATQAPPAAHGVLAWFAYLEDADVQATVLPFVERYSKRPLSEFGVDAGTVLRASSQIGCLGPAPATVVPANIARSVYSGWFAGGAPTTGYTSLRGATDAIVARIAAARTPTFTYLYVPYVDATQHDYGVGHARVRRALRRVEARLERLAGRLALRHARLVVTADHGLVHVPPERQHHLAPDDPLRALLRADPSGEPRLPLFHVAPGRSEAFELAFRARFGEEFALLPSGEAAAARLFGAAPLSATARARLGDYVAVPLATTTFSYRQETPMLGYHGGLHPDEMRVPLVVA